MLVDNRKCLRPSFDPRVAGVDCPKELVAQAIGLDLVPVEGGLDIRFGERPNPEWPHLAVSIHDPGAHLRPRRPDPRIGFLLGESVVQECLVGFRDRKAVQVNVIRDTIPDILNEFQPLSHREPPIVEHGFTGHKTKLCDFAEKGKRNYATLQKQRTPGSPSKSGSMVQSVALNCWAVAKMMLSARGSLWSMPSLAAASARPLSRGTICA